MSAAEYRETVKAPKKGRAEADVHISIVNYINRVLPHNLMAHPANGEKRSKEAAKKLKCMGVRAGVPDLFIPLGCGKILWLEIKKPGGVLSKPQREYIKKLRDYGHPVAIVESIDDVRNTFKAMGIVTRESVR